MSHRKKLILINASIIIVLLLLYLFSGSVFRNMEKTLLDQLLYQRGRQTVDPRIAIVAIDEKSLTQLGPWPWPRDDHAQLIRRLKEAGAKTIGFDIYFQSAAATETSPKAADQNLLEAVHEAGNVILAEYYHLTPPGPPLPGPISTPLPAAIHSFESKELLDGYQPFQANQRQASFIDLAQLSDGSGHINRLVEKDGRVREELLVLEYDHQFIPSLALKIAQKFWSVDNRQMVLVGGQGIRIGPHLIQTESPLAEHPPLLGTAYINFKGGAGLYPTYSFADVMTDRYPSHAFQDKIVLVGATAPGLFDNIPTIFTAALPGIEKHAQVIDNILHNDFIHTPLSLQAILAILFFVASWAWALLIPFIRDRICLPLGLILSLMLLGGTYGLLIDRNIWLRPIPYLFAIWLPFGATLIYRQWIAKNKQERVMRTNYETLKELGLAYQAKGELEKAYHTFNQLPLNEETSELLYHLAKQLEKTRKDSLANQIFEMIANPKAADTKNTQMGRNPTRLMAMYAQAPPTVGAAPDRNLQTGQNIGRYEVLDFLGEGAMGEVYVAQDPHMDRPVAVKTYRFKKYLQENEITNFQDNLIKEAKLAGKLNHPNIITFYDAGKDWDLTYVVMEYLKDGTDLSHYCQPQNQLPPNRILDIIEAMAQGLDCIHRNGIIHRDIKPANIMMLPNGLVKIMDFGVAFDQHHTEEVLLAGTPIYMAPEQLIGLPIDARADLYALGQVWFELLIGRHAYAAHTMSELIKFKQSTPSPRLSSYRSDLPPHTQMLLDGLLAPDPQERFPSSQSFINQLSNLKTS